jgi:hypothetical protein
VVDHLLAQQALDFDHFGYRHQLAFPAAQLELEQLVDVVLAFGRQHDAHRDFVLGVTVVHRRHVLAGETHAHHLDHVLLRHTEQRRLGLIHAQHQLFRVLVHRVVDADDVGRALKGSAHLIRHCDLSGVVGTINLRDDGRHDRRAGRHFDDLGIAAMLLGHGDHALAHRDGNLVALPVAMLLVHQVHLDIAHFRRAAQVVLAHQAIEVDRRGRAGVGLVVGNLGHLGDLDGNLAQHLGGFLQRRADRHVEHDLEFALVVEGQHLQHHQLEEA